MVTLLAVLHILEGMIKGGEVFLKTTVDPFNFSGRRNGNKFTRFSIGSYGVKRFGKGNVNVHDLLGGTSVMLEADGMTTSHEGLNLEILVIDGLFGH